MSIRNWFLGTLLGISLPVFAGTALGQQERTEPGKDADEPQQLEPIAESQLRKLEQAATQRASATTQRPTAGDNYKVYKAAGDYAAALAGMDDAKFTKLATGAMLRAAAVETGISEQIDALAPPAQAMMAPRALVSAPAGADSEIWEEREFQKNFRDLMQRAGQSGSRLSPVFGPPSVQRVVGPGSRVTSEDEYRDCVCVGTRVGANDRFCCTGTLIGKNVVVTAGHCYFCVGGGATNQSVVFIGTDTSKPGKRYTGTITRHPEYGKGNRHNDVSVIVLDDDVTEVEPRPIATTAQVNAATFVRAVGFGNSDFASTTGFGTKRLVDVPVASISCSRPTDPKKLGCDKSLELVAGFVGLGPDSCNGDSGGPVYVLIGDDASKDKNWAISGATSRGTNSSVRPCGDGGIYVRLDKYLSFIKGIPGGHF